jgi:hypothetical protein
MEIFRALATLAEPPAPEHARLVELLDLPGAPDGPGGVEYAELFLFQLYPYASVYLGDEGKLGGEARDRVAGFWRALGREPPPDPDHLAVLLALYADLCEQEHAERDPARRLLWRNSRQALLWEHLLSWLPPYLDKLAEIASPFYQAWGRLVQESLLTEASELGGLPQVPSSIREPSPLREMAVGDPAAFLDQILAPRRCGMILVRADLIRAASELDVPVRIGERRGVLETLFSQEPLGTLRWLEREALNSASRHRSWRERVGPVADFWAAQAEAAAATLASTVKTMDSLRR